MSRVVKLGQNL